jgi:hypothetical protein
MQLRCRIIACAILSAVGLVVSCKPSAFKSGAQPDKEATGAEKGATDISAKQPGDSPIRPTDGAEGVSGYLTDPALVRYTRGGDAFEAKGVKGAVGAQNGESASTVAVGLWVLRGNIAGDDQVLRVDVTNVACPNAEADGSFLARSRQRNDRYILTFGLDCGARTLTIARRRDGKVQAVYPKADLSGEFVDAFVGHREDCYCPSGQVYYELSRRCEPRYDTCFDRDYPGGPVCGCDGKPYAKVCDAKESGLIFYSLGSCR